MSKKTILILGAGFGGLRTAIILGKKLKRSNLTEKYEIVLIDRNDYQLYTPILYEVATTPKEIAGYLMLEHIITFPIIKSLENLPVVFSKNIVESLDIENAKALLDSGGELHYEYAVIALGSETNDFGIPGIKQYSYQFKTFLDAIKLRDNIFALVQEDNFPIRIVVGGGGSTGVELAAELAKLAQRLAQQKNKHVLTVSLIEGSGSVLSNFGIKITAPVTDRLKKLNVGLITGESISSVIEKRVVLKSNKIIPYDLFVWTGGVKASDMLSHLPLKIERQGKVKVEDEMLCVPATDHLHLAGKVYGLGDSICFYDPKTQKPIAGVARAAISQAAIVAKNIFEDIQLDEQRTKKAVHHKYVPVDYPYIIPVGGKWAIAKIGPFVIKGYFGWVLKGLVELNYLASIMPLKKALSVWFAGLKIFMKNDKLS
jgi:NADH dehydrogenase